MMSTPWGRHHGRSPPSFRSMAGPTREFDKLMVLQKLAHGGNPVTPLDGCPT
jgi:hypothetical protein